MAQKAEPYKLTYRGAYDKAQTLLDLLWGFATEHQLDIIALELKAVRKSASSYDAVLEVMFEGTQKALANAQVAVKQFAQKHEVKISFVPISQALPELFIIPVRLGGGDQTVQ